MRESMTRTLSVITLVAAAALAGCNNEPEIIGPPGGEQTPASEVALPPSIASSKVYRCADNQIVNVDWLSDNKTANVRTKDGESVTQVTAPAEGQPFTGPGGFQITGKPGDSTVNITLPGKSAQSCKA